MSESQATNINPGTTTQGRPLGLWMATALVVGSMIGSGVFMLPAALAPYGAASLVGWGIALTGALLLAATFAKLAELGIEWAARPGDSW